MNTATRCAYTALTLSPARASHTRQLPGGALCDPGLFFPLGVERGGWSFPLHSGQPPQHLSGPSGPVPQPGRSPGGLHECPPLGRFLPPVTGCRRLARVGSLFFR